MNAKIQILSLGISFIYGIIFFYLSKLNNSIIKDKKRLYRSIITILYMCNIVLLYIIIIFKINNGKFHIYFFFMIILGFIIGLNIQKRMLKNVKFRSFIDKLKKKCYTKEK